MRRLALPLLLVACAHAVRSKDPHNWVELRSEHFLVRTDLPEEDSRKSVADMELVRLALLGAGWHSTRPENGRTIVVQLASREEMQEFARKGYEGFAGSNAFGEPMIVLSGAQNVLEQELFKHELAHVINDGFLVSKPRWVNEGIACYLETLQIRRGRGEAVMGKPSSDRLAYLQQRPILRWFDVIDTGREAMQQSAEEGYAFETGAWALVHWMVDTRPKAFEGYLTRLARGENAWSAFDAAFPGLREEKLSAAMRDYLKEGRVRLSTLPLPGWTGEIAARALEPAEVLALRADLLRISPGYGPRRDLVEAELRKALAIDPGNPYALMLQPGSDGKAAVAAHPDDWRSWLVAADRNQEDRADLEQAMKLAPDDAGVNFRMAFAEQSAGESEHALLHAARAAELAPGRTDVLDALAQIYAANARCDEAQSTEQRAIDAVPDAASTQAPRELLQRLRNIRENCGAAAAALRSQVSGRTALKSCSQEMPRVVLRYDMRAEFTLREDGSVTDVRMVGDAPPETRAALQHFVESCTYQPVVIDGKPQKVQTTATFSVDHK